MNPRTRSKLETRIKETVAQVILRDLHDPRCVERCSPGEERLRPQPLGDGPERLRPGPIRARGEAYEQRSADLKHVAALDRGGPLDAADLTLAHPHQWNQLWIAEGTYYEADGGLFELGTGVSWGPLESTATVIVTV